MAQELRYNILVTPIGSCGSRGVVLEGSSVEVGGASAVVEGRGVELSSTTAPYHKLMVTSGCLDMHTVASSQLTAAVSAQQLQVTVQTFRPRDQLGDQLEACTG